MPIEFQGHGSRTPMPLRVLDYQTRMVIHDSPAMMLAIVCYVEHGAGSHDTGHHQIASVGPHPALAWHYLVVHLWRMNADDLLAAQRPAIVPLIGLTKMDDPERVIREAVEQLEQVPDQQERETLTIELQALARNEQIKSIIEYMLRRKNMVFHSPFLEEIREEGLQEGIGKGREEGLQEGIGKGRLLTVRDDILDLIAERFNPSLNTYRSIDRVLGQIHDYDTLRALLIQVVRVATVDEFHDAVVQQQATTPQQ
jgi:predicted transposase YdaD